MATIARRQATSTRYAARPQQRLNTYLLLKLARTLAIRIVTYLILADIAFVFLFPVFYMLATSIKSVQDLTDPTIQWIASGIDWQNYILAWQAINFWHSFSNSAQIAILSGVGQVISCAFVGYGFGRINFPGREILFLLVIFTFLVPPETIIVPLFILYKTMPRLAIDINLASFPHIFAINGTFGPGKILDHGWIDTYWPFIFPSFLGEGLKGSVFVLIFRQFFRGLPWELEEAARVDGAGPLATFFRIMLPLAKPAILVSFLFSVVWHWNDYLEPLIYLNRSELFTLPMRLSVLGQTLNEVTGGAGSEFYNEALAMAACVLVILPVLILYLFTQRFFTESIDRTGVVG
ncbi:MAG: carbohydrate ABC transporter permease [Chloroflexi bacterium]|nr:carbohydrate ABC transporter permease [Chloroflexota bacterium]